MPNNGEYSQEEMNLQQNMMINHTRNMSNQQSPSRLKGNYLQYEHNSRGCNDQHNESFVSLLHDQINTMNDEVKKLAHNSARKVGKPTQ